MSLAKRSITWWEHHAIDRNGVVWHMHKRVPTTSVASKHGVWQLAVQGPDERKIVIWPLLSHMWYGGRMILPRDGNALNWHADNTIDLAAVSSLTEKTFKDPAEILKIWTVYCSGCGCWALAERTAIHLYSRDEFYSLVKDILVAGIR